MKHLFYQRSKSARLGGNVRVLVTACSHALGGTDSSYVTLIQGFVALHISLETFSHLTYPYTCFTYIISSVRKINTIQRINLPSIFLQSYVHIKKKKRKPTKKYVQYK